MSAAGENGLLRPLGDMPGRGNDEGEGNGHRSERFSVSPDRSPECRSGDLHSAFRGHPGQRVFGETGILTWGSQRASSRLVAASSVFPARFVNSPGSPSWS